MGIENTHLAFCFDEAVEYILSHRYYKEVKKDNKVYQETMWRKKPRWIDEETEEKEENSFISNLEINLEKQKKLRNIK